MMDNTPDENENNFDPLKAKNSKSIRMNRLDLKKCSHCPPQLSHKTFKGLRGLESHHNWMHKDIEFTDHFVKTADDAQNVDISLDFSIDGAQSLNLQSYLCSKGVVQSDTHHKTTDFYCTSCKRSFDTFKGLQIHRSHHDKLFEKIRVKEFDRKHKGFDQEFFLSSQQEDYDLPSNDLEEFLIMNGINSSGKSEETVNVPITPEPLSQDDSNNTTCSVCRFVAKSKGGLKLHMKIHVGSKLDDKSLYDDSNVNVGKLSDVIAFYRRNTRLLHQIPKGARAAAADKLSKLIDMCILKNDLTSWRCLFLFSYTALYVPEKENNISLTSAVKKNILSNHHNHSKNVLTQHPRTHSKDSLFRRIEEKVADGDIKNAMRLLTSEDSLAPETEETFRLLENKHPKPSRIIHLPEAPINATPIIVDDRTVSKAINSYKKGSAAGLDGLKPQFLKDMLSKQCGEAATRLLKSITNLMNFMLAGKLCSEICEYLFGAVLIALKKKTEASVQ